MVLSSWIFPINWNGGQETDLIQLCQHQPEEKLLYDHQAMT